MPGELRPWPQPFRNALPQILAERGRKVCVLATSDPFHYGIGNSLSRAIPAQEMRIIPQISSFAMACSRMRWPQEECALVSLHGRTLYRIVPHLQPGARILALSWDETTPRAVAELMTARGLGGSRIVVMESLGGPQERVRETRADSFAFDDIVPLNIIAVDVAAGRDSRILPLAPGLDEDWFAHDGQITKSEIRAITLSALAPAAANCSGMSARARAPSRSNGASAISATRLSPSRPGPSARTGSHATKSNSAASRSKSSARRLQASPGAKRPMPCSSAAA